MNVLQHTRNELNLCLKQNRPDRSYRDTLLKREHFRVILEGRDGGYKLSCYLRFQLFCQLSISNILQISDLICQLESVSFLREGKG